MVEQAQERSITEVEPLVSDSTPQALTPPLTDLTGPAASIHGVNTVRPFDVDETSPAFHSDAPIIPAVSFSAEPIAPRASGPSTFSLVPELVAQRLTDEATFATNLLDGGSGIVKGEDNPHVVEDFNKALFTNREFQPHAMAVSEEDLSQSQANLLDLTERTNVTAIGEIHDHSVKNGVSAVSEEVIDPSMMGLLPDESSGEPGQSMVLVDPVHEMSQPIERDGHKDTYLANGGSRENSEDNDDCLSNQAGLADPAQLTDIMIQPMETRVAPSANEIAIEAPTVQTNEPLNRSLDSESPPSQSGEETGFVPLSPLDSSTVLDDKHEQRPLGPVLPEEVSGSSTVDPDTLLNAYPEKWTGNLVEEYPQQMTTKILQLLCSNLKIYLRIMA
ncbi:hypothetical protein JB92DRAFT_427178 [Gautieria morchelliformis]|nr:hypothetical protein JB92DRAFT_427178 [Gautieria morchelliformis]